MTDITTDAKARLFAKLQDVCLLDENRDAHDRLIEMRGGCRCCISPPCNACVEPITFDEAERLGLLEDFGAAASELLGTERMLPPLSPRRGPQPRRSLWPFNAAVTIEEHIAPGNVRSTRVLGPPDVVCEAERRVRWGARHE